MNAVYLQLSYHLRLLSIWMLLTLLHCADVGFCKSRRFCDHSSGNSRE